MSPKLCLVLTALCGLAAQPLAAGVLPLENPGFENELTGWVLLEKNLPQPMSTVSPEAAHQGTSGLRVEDTDPELGSSLASQNLPAEPGRTYRLTFHVRADYGDKGAVYLRFRDGSKKVINPDKLPNLPIKKTEDWEPYTLEAVAPEGTATISIWIHSWSGATGIIEFDDFAIEEVAGTAAVPPPAAAPAQLAASPVAKREKPAMIVLKLDDLKASKSGIPHPAWTHVLEILKTRRIKAGIGIICNSLEAENPAYFQWIKDARDTGLVEFWFHGYTHDVRTENDVRLGEFVGRSHQDQKRRFEGSAKLASSRLGLELRTFGPPGGGNSSFDETTVRVMSEVPGMEVWLYPQPADETARQLNAAGKVTVLDRVWQVNIEHPLFVPNAEKLISSYAKFPAREYFVIQGHPTHWKEEGFAEFEKILDFLTGQDAQFVTPVECAQALAKNQGGSTLGSR